VNSFPLYFSCFPAWICSLWCEGQESRQRLLYRILQVLQQVCTLRWCTAKCSCCTWCLGQLYSKISAHCSLSSRIVQCYSNRHPEMAWSSTHSSPLLSSEAGSITCISLGRKSLQDRHLTIHS